MTAPHRRLAAALLAAAALVAVVVSACLTSSAGPHPDAPGFPEPATADGRCPDQAPPVPACHNQADLQVTTPASGPRPDVELRWDHPRYAAERAGRPGSPVPAPAPDLIALSISRT